MTEALTVTVPETPVKAAKCIFLRSYVISLVVSYISTTNNYYCNGYCGYFGYDFGANFRSSGHFSWRGYWIDIVLGAEREEIEILRSETVISRNVPDDSKLGQLHFHPRQWGQRTLPKTYFSRYGWLSLKATDIWFGDDTTSELSQLHDFIHQNLLNCVLWYLLSISFKLLP